MGASVKPTATSRGALCLLLAWSLAACDSGGGSQGTSQDAGSIDQRDARGNRDASDDSGTHDADGVDAEGIDDTGTSDAGTRETGAVVGVAYDAETGRPLAGVLVGASDEAMASSNADGTFRIDDLGVGEHLLSIRGAGFARTFKKVEIFAAETSYLEVFAPRIGLEQRIDATSGGEAVDPATGARAWFGPNSLVNGNGEAVEGEVTVSLTSLNPREATQLKAFPGEFTGLRADRSEVALVTYGPMEITVMKGSEELDLALGESAEISFPIYEADAPDTIPLWSLDEATGLWNEEGIAIRTDDANGRRVYRSAIGHMSWWNPDVPVERTCVRVCVTDEGVPARGALVAAMGIGYGYAASRNVDDTGCASLNVRRNRPVSLRASGAAGASDPVVVDAPDTASDRSDPNCVVVATLEFDPRPRVDCPSGMLDCGGSCVDLSLDSDHCGVCARGCTISGAVCVSGQCSCPAPMLECGWACVDPESDSSSCGGCSQPFGGPIAPFVPRCYTGESCCAELGRGTCEVATGISECRTLNTNSDCGACGNVCPSTQFCSFDGQCLPLACAANEVACGSRCVVGSDCTGFCAWRGQCAPSEDCVGNRCQPLSCGAGEVACDHACVPGTQCGEACADGESCQGSSCAPSQCAAGLSACGNGCVDTTSDARHCGGCGNWCGEGFECVGSTCQIIACPQGQVWCDGGCIDPLADPGHCGGCWVREFDVQGCAGAGCCANFSQFACPTGTPDTYLCVDFASDENHCGQCGTVCGADEVCRDGTCEALACPPGRIGCNHRCVNGSVCGQVCASGICTNGSCAN